MFDTVITPVEKDGARVMEAPSILVAEDEKPMRRLLELTYQAEGYRVITAQNGAEAVRKAILERPDLIVLDIIMPEMDGLQVLQELRLHPETEDIPVILLTGKKEEEDIVEGWQYSIEVYLTKPYVVEDLLSITERILADRAASRLPI